MDQKFLIYNYNLNEIYMYDFNLYSNLIINCSFIVNY